MHRRETRALQITLLRISYVAEIEAAIAVGHFCSVKSQESILSGKWLPKLPLMSTRCSMVCYTF
jgi:hypothetical protein